MSYLCVTHGLGLMLIGVIIGKKTLLFKNALQALQRTPPVVGWTVGASRVGRLNRNRPIEVAPWAEPWMTLAGLYTRDRLV